MAGYIDFLLDFADKFQNYNEKLDYEEDDYEDKIDRYDKRMTKKMLEFIKNFENKNIDSFESTGIISKNISNELRSELLTNINEYVKKIPIDYHPGSENKVQVIIHPSIYPLIKDAEEKPTKKFDIWKRKYENSKYQWLPSEVSVTNYGKCKFTSYINNLPIEETKLYANLESVLQNIIPYFEKCIEHINTQSLDDDTKLSINKSIRGNTIQIIPKIVKVSLKNNESILGAWHVEGMSHENIIATATCTLEQSDDFSTELYFKTLYNDEEAEKLLYGMPQSIHYTFKEYGKIVNKEMKPLGKVNVKQGDIYVFPNSHVHKVDMKNTKETDSKEPLNAERTLLVFWLINPDVRITSTKDIPQQNYNIEEAHANRLKLMDERKYYKQSFNQRELNLCEH